jgi:hypothetical protein
MSKITAIIAIRNELPENVERTVTSVKAAGGIPALIEDNPQLGCGYRRHQGIERCETENCLLIDGHMTFSPGYFEIASAWLDKHPSDLTCTRMQSVGHDWIDRPGKPYHGARLELCHEAAGEQFWPIASRWRKGDTGDGPIGAVMGACYGLTRSAYMQQWGSPLSILQAWGCDEEALSVAAWMTGGRVVLIPGLARHMYAAPKIGGGGPIGMQDAARIWANRVALLSAIPMPEPERARLENLPSHEQGNPPREDRRTVAPRNRAQGSAMADLQRGLLARDRTKRMDRRAWCTRFLFPSRWQSRRFCRAGMPGAVSGQG